MPNINLLSGEIFRKKFSNYLAIGLAGLTIYSAFIGGSKIAKNHYLNATKAYVQKTINSGNLGLADSLLGLYKKNRAIRPEDGIALGIAISHAKETQSSEYDAKKAEAACLDSIKLHYSATIGKMNERIGCLEAELAKTRNATASDTQKETGGTTVSYLAGETEKKSYEPKISDELKGGDLGACLEALIDTIDLNIGIASEIKTAKVDSIGKYSKMKKQKSNRIRLMKDYAIVSREIRELEGYRADAIRLSHKNEFFMKNIRLSTKEDKAVYNQGKAHAFFSLQKDVAWVCSNIKTRENGGYCLLVERLSEAQKMAKIAEDSLSGLKKENIFSKKLSDGQAQLIRKSIEELTMRKNALLRRIERSILTASAYKAGRMIDKIDLEIAAKQKLLRGESE